MPLIITIDTPRATALTANGSDLERHERSGTIVTTLKRACADASEARSIILAHLGDANIITGPEDDLVGQVLDLQDNSSMSITFPHNRFAGKIEVDVVTWERLTHDTPGLDTWHLTVDPRPEVQSALCERWTDANGIDTLATLDPFYGVIWPIASDCDDSLPWIERDDEADIYADDIHAAKAVARLVGGRVMFATTGTHDDTDRNYLQPFVLPPTAVSTDGLGEHRLPHGYGWDDWSFLCQRAKRDARVGLGLTAARTEA